MLAMPKDSTNPWTLGRKAELRMIESGSQITVYSVDTNRIPRSRPRPWLRLTPSPTTRALAALSSRLPLREPFWTTTTGHSGLTNRRNDFTSRRQWTVVLKSTVNKVKRRSFRARPRNVCAATADGQQAEPLHRDERSSQPTTLQYRPLPPGHSTGSCP